MLKSDLHALIEAGEGSRTEFKRDGVRPEQLAKEIASFANMNGGRILLGVENDGTISGVQPRNLQAWVMDTVVGRYVVPSIIPDYDEVAMDGGRVAVIDVPAGAAKPYAVKRGERFDYYLRLGNTGQLASREQMARLFETGGLVSVEKMPVHGSVASELDHRRLREYFERILGTTRRTRMAGSASCAIATFWWTSVKANSGAATQPTPCSPWSPGGGYPSPDCG